MSRLFLPGVRVVWAQSVVKNPDVVVLDEPDVLIVPQSKESPASIELNPKSDSSNLYIAKIPEGVRQDRFQLNLDYPALSASLLVMVVVTWLCRKVLNWI